MPTWERIQINQGQLYDLYWKQRLSLYAIAKLFSCNHVTVLNRMKKFGIPRRTRLGNRKPLNLSKNTLVFLYHERGLSLKKIALIIHRSEGGVERQLKSYGIPTRNIANRASKYKKTNFNGELIEKAYLIGFRLGDLNVKKIKNVIQVRCSTTHKNQVNLIKNLFRNYTTPHIWKAMRGTYEIVCFLNKSFHFLLPKHKTIPSWIKKNPKYFWAFIAGYVDAEGSFYEKRTKYKQKTYRQLAFEVQSQDRNILQAVYKFLQNNGIRQQKFSVSKNAGYINKRGIKNNLDVWRISITHTKSITKLIQKTKPYLKHREKIKKISRLSTPPSQVPKTPSFPPLL